MTKPISPLRQRMIDDMKLRNMSRSSQQIYTSPVARFAPFHGRSPDQLGIEYVRQFRLHLLDRGLKATTINPIVGALRFFCGTTLGNKEIAAQIPYARPEDTLPAVLTPDAGRCAHRPRQISIGCPTAPRFRATGVSTTPAKAIASPSVVPAAS